MSAAEALVNDYFAPHGCNGLRFDLPPRPADGMPWSSAQAGPACGGRGDGVEALKPAAGVVSADAYLASAAAALRLELAEGGFMPRGAATASCAAVASASPVVAVEQMLRAFTPLPAVAGAAAAAAAAAEGSAALLLRPVAARGATGAAFEGEAEAQAAAEAAVADAAAVAAQRSDALAVVSSFSSSVAPLSRRGHACGLRCFLTHIRAHSRLRFAIFL